MDIQLVRADYRNPAHRHDIPLLLNTYASGAMGGGKPLQQHVLNELVDELAKREFAFSVLAYCDGAAAGLVNCFEGFSTFRCMPLVNIHDVIVLEQYRGMGLCSSMLKEVERIAVERGCCKLTLEVLSENEAAMSAYRKSGFSPYQLDPQAGTAQFWEKPLVTG